MDINLKDEVVQVKVVIHPGFNYANTYDRAETAEKKVCRFGGDKIALIGKDGGFFGKEPQYLEFKSSHKFSCLTVFKNRESAKEFVEFINWKIKAQLEMAWLDIS